MNQVNSSNAATQLATKTALVLPALPYAESALEPIISARTLSFHYGKHHKAYVDNLNKLIFGTEYADFSLVDLIKKTAGKSDKAAIFNNAAQVWNHSFYWQSLSPKNGVEPPAELKSKLVTAFGSVTDFKKDLAAAAVAQFGSGWVWLILENGKLKITKTANAENPLALGQQALLTIDVWEHAYYLDYQNRRPDYVNMVIEKLLNWEFIIHNLG